MKRVNVILKKEIHSQAKIISVLKNIPLNKYLEHCIQKGIKEDKGIFETIKTKGEDEEA